MNNLNKKISFFDLKLEELSEELYSLKEADQIH